MSSNSINENNCPKKTINILSKISNNDSKLLIEKENLIRKLQEENDEFQSNYIKICQKVEELLQKDKLNQILIDSLRKENSSIEQKYNDKCSEIESVEEKFDEISKNFTYILEKIKSHQDSLLEDNQRLKDLISFILACYNEKKFDSLNCIVNFISKNDTFIDKTTIGEYNNMIMTKIKQNKSNDDKVCEYLYTSENNEKDKENKLFFENSKDRLRSCSTKEIKFLTTNGNAVNTSNKTISYSRNKKSCSKSKNTSSYSNIHRIQRNSSTISVKTYMNLSKSQKDFSSDTLKHSSNQGNTAQTARSSYRCQQNEYQSESKESSDNAIKLESISSSPNIDKFLNNISISSLKSEKKVHPKGDSKVISKDLEHLMTQKLNDFKTKAN